MQIVPRDFVGGGDLVTATAPPGLGERRLGNLRMTVSASNTPTSGQQTVFTLRVADADSAPVTDLEPWLGMGTHMIAHRTDGQIFARVRTAAPMAAAGSAIRYGPEIRFVYTFPSPGEYRIWQQVRRGAEIITVPIRVVVA